MPTPPRLERGRDRHPRKPRPPVSEVIEKQLSMLGENGLPDTYGFIETAEDALEAAEPPVVNVPVLRLHIMWDNPANNLSQSLERALEEMRSTGAAMVVKVERLP